jgi:type I restriction enzyme M protein
LAFDRTDNPVTVSGWKITERVPLSEDLTEHMKREVLPFSPDAQCDETKAKHGNEIPFTRIFFAPKEPRPLAEIDFEVQKLMGELADMFRAVSEE